MCYYNSDRYKVHEYIILQFVSEVSGIFKFGNTFIEIT